MEEVGIRKLAVLFSFALLLVVACGDINGWSQAQRDAFRNSCITSRNLSPEVCKCWEDAVVENINFEKYDNTPENATKSKEQKEADLAEIEPIMTRLLQECQSR